MALLPVRHTALMAVLPHLEITPQRDRTGWLGRQDSNLGMAESKSTYSAFDFNDHSEKSAKFDPFPINRLDADSRIQNAPPVWRMSCRAS
jgi:hypothetical protein